MSQSPLFRLEGSAGARRHFRYFDYVMAAFVTILLLSNLIGAGKRAVVVGRSVLVGKPIALLLLEQNATVTICHSRTADLAGEIGQADVVIAALGRPEAIRGDWIKPGAAVIDVGINRTDDGLKGDVEFASASQHASFLTPVPGGVGPMTIAMLLRNTVSAAARA